MSELISVLHRNGDIIDYFPGCYNIDKNNARDLGNKTKSFGMTWGTYRKLSGAACELWDQRKYKPVFLTFTSKDPLDETKSNRLLGNYLKNLSLNYQLNNFLWVREYQERGAVHYHSVLDLPYIDIRSLNDLWVYTIRDYSRPSKNALQFSPGWGGVVRSRQKVVRYVCKYISKYGPGGRSIYKNYGYSRSLVKKPLCIDQFTKEDILRIYGRYTFRHDYGTIYFTKNNKDLYHHVRKYIDSSR